MQAPHKPGEHDSTAFDPAKKKPCQRSSRRKFLWLSDVLASCEDQGDIVTAICRVLGQKPSYLALQTTWPWLKTRIRVPCKCRVTHPSVLVTLCHLYDEHVVETKTWPFFRLVQWARQMQTRLAPPPSPEVNGERCTRCGSKMPTAKKIG